MSWVPVHEIKIASNLRKYVYIARVTKRTGKLVGIKAGCQHWKDFHAAFAHYESANNQRPEKRWTDNWIVAQSERRNMFAIYNPQERRDELVAHRMEARAILRKLRDKMHKYYFRCNRRRDRERKAKR